MSRRPGRLRRGLLVLIAVAWAGCAPEEHYATLSLFFNDPPRPPRATTAPATRGGPTPSRARHDGPAALQFVHRPYRAGQCQACHGPKQEDRTAALDPSTCAACHPNPAAAYPVAHTAVSNRACLWCHAPHESDQPVLLRISAPALCLQCHDPEVLRESCGGAHLKQAACMECHAAHGGADRRLLRADAATPTTQISARTGGPTR